MATKTGIPAKSHVVTTRDGNWYLIMECEHTNNSAADTTDYEVPLSAVSVAELPTSGNGIAKTNLTISDSSTPAGTRYVRFATGAADGTYTIVVRCIGSGAGFGSSHVG